jgi:hypothetical protein
MDAVLDSAIRHLFDYLEGKRNEDHLAAASWNVMNLIHTEEQIERGNLPKSLAEGLPDYTLKITPVPPEDVYVDPEEVNQTPYSVWDGPYRSTGNPAVSCTTCIHRSPVGGPVPMSEWCDKCKQFSNYRRNINV